MSTWGGFLALAIGPLAKRALSALGVGVVTFTGVNLAVSGLLEGARDSWAGMPADVAAYLAFGGFNTALSIICGGITARVTMIALKRFALL